MLVRQPEKNNLRLYCSGGGGSVITEPSLAVILMSAQFTKVSCFFPCPTPHPLSSQSQLFPTGPPPLHHAVITCQSPWKKQLTLEHVISRGGYLPFFLAIGLLQNISQFFLCDRRLFKLSHSEHEESLVVRSDIYHHLDLLFLVMI